MLNVTKVDTWAATIDDRPGGLLAKLEGLAKAGADLDFILARRTHEKPGQGALFVTPITDARQSNAAEQLGFHRTSSLHTLRVEGPDEPGVAYEIAQALAAEGINLRGLSAMTIGSQYRMFLAFDTQADADRAAARLQRAL